MVNELNNASPMTVKNTFTAICFHSKGRGLSRSETLEAVSVTGGKIGTVKSFDIFSNNRRASRGMRATFADVQHLVEDCNMPIVGWGSDSGNRLRSLIDVYDIDIEHPIRYFDLKDSARRKMGDATAERWQTVSAKLGVETDGRPYPSSRDCAKIHLALEKIDYRLIVARAFLTFIRSIMYDPYTPNAIDTTEAKGLQAFLSVLTDDFKQFKSLKELVDKALDDDVIVEHESRDLMLELKKMEFEYQKIIDSRQ